MINLKEYNLEKIYLPQHLPQCGSKYIEYTFDENFIMLNIYKNKFIDFVIDADYNLLLGQGHYKLNKKRDFLYLWLEKLRKFSKLNRQLKAPVFI